REQPGWERACKLHGQLETDAEKGAAKEPGERLSGCKETAFQGAATLCVQEVFCYESFPECYIGKLKIKNVGGSILGLDKPLGKLLVRLVLCNPGVRILLSI